jgi:ferric-dicitrate binding protein FerR (iron transport regulator)
MMLDAFQYETYEITDFLLEDSFVQWVQTDHNSDFWKAFLISYPHKTQLLDQARAIILAGEMVPTYYPTESQIAQMWGAILRAIDQSNHPLLFTGKSKKVWTYAAAASVVLLLGAWAWFGINPSNHITYQTLLSQVDYPLHEVVNPNRHPLVVKLPDGSIVKLQKGGRISYPGTFAASARHVYLSGEGFFQVTKNPNQPFFVHANELVTKVLGTSFTIRTYDSDNRASVIVRTGKVSVFTQADIKIKKDLSSRELEGVVLTPNQQLTFDREEIRMVKSLVAEPVLIDSVLKAKAFSFDNVPISKVFKTFEDAYGVDILYDEELLGNCRLSAEMSDEPLFEKLRLICKTLGGSYSVIDAQIVIQSGGCDH